MEILSNIRHVHCNLQLQPFLIGEIEIGQYSLLFKIKPVIYKIYCMKTFYPLKKGDPMNLVEPLVKYLEMNDSPKAAMSMRDSLGQINQLRNKVVSLELPANPATQMIDKFIQIYEMYVRYARLIAKHFNWNPEYGNIVQDCNITWSDSFNPQLKFMKPEIHFDIFCCYYNLGILYFQKASMLCYEDLGSSKKEAIGFAKRAFYYFYQMRNVFYSGFVNTGFSDTNYPHLEMLESLSLGIIYKCMFDIFKEDEFKHGINKIASLAALAQDNFFKAYQIGSQFFMKSSNINNAIKSELLSLAYVQSLYHDVIANSKYAKYYENEMDNNKDHIVLLIAYQRKALRLLNLGLSNENVVHLLNQRPEQKKDLLNIKPLLEGSLNKNVMRNTEIYKKQQIAEDKMPLPFEAPKEYLVSPVQPKEVALQYESKSAAPFMSLMDNDSKAFVNELRDFSQNRLQGLQSAYSKLSKNIETIYNDCYVNYYLNLQQNAMKTGVPQNLKKKLEQVRMNGGKQKLDMEIKIIKKNSELSKKSFQDLKNKLLQQQNEDNQLRGKYGNQWKRPISSVIQKPYRNQIDVYENKANQADQVNQKLIMKYEELQQYIKMSEASDNELIQFLPKVQITQFIEENKNDFKNLKEGATDVKTKMEALDSITDELRMMLTKIDYTQVAQENFGESKNSKEQVLEKIFGKAYKLIEAFNEKAKYVEEQAKRAGDISGNLNKKNKGDESNKKQFEAVMGKFNDVNNLFRDIAQGTGFYTKLNDILAKIDNDVDGLNAARRLEAQDIEQSLGKKGEAGNFGGPSLPSMYPNQQPQQNLGFYVPPPMHFDNNPNQPNNSNFSMGGGGGLKNMLNDLMASKPSFDTNLWGKNNNVYQSKYK